MLRLIALCGFLAAALSGQQINIQFAPNQTQIHWTLNGNVHITHGTFRLKRGHVLFDRATNSITGEIVIDATSGDSGNESRDKRMNKEVLESDRYAEFSFSPAKVEGSLARAGQSTLLVSGAFSIHGSRHNVQVPVVISFDGATAHVSGQFSIPYVDWGMKDPSNFLFKVDKSVQVQVIAVGQIASK